MERSTTTLKNSTTTYDHLRNIPKHPQTIEYHPKQAPNVQIKQDDTMSCTWHTSTAQNLHVPLESYSQPRSTTRLKDVKSNTRSFYSCFILPSEDLSRTLQPEMSSYKRRKKKTIITFLSTLVAKRVKNHRQYGQFKIFKNIDRTN